MANIIHMETELVRAAARQLEQIAETIDECFSDMENKLKALDWQGPVRNHFLSEFQKLSRETTSAAESGFMLGLRTRREASEWELADQKGATEIVQLGNCWRNILLGLLIGGPIGGTIVISELVDTYYDLKEYTDWWSGLTRAERLVFLQEQHNIILQQNGMDPIPVLDLDLPDTNGDSRGLHTGDTIYIDVDNLDNDPPWKILNTLAHESRHELQETWVERYEQFGEIPQGMTEKQIEAMSENFKNYTKPDDDFEGYWKQAIEADARDYGSQYAAGVVENRSWKN